jgi:hypothetical protein
MGRSTTKDGPMTHAERQARYRARKRKSINRRRRTLYKLAKEGDGREAARLRREASRNAEPLPDGRELRIGDCRKMLADIPNDSVALVLTDPPYTFEADLLWHWLAEFAARVLVPGGSLICYTGHARVPRDHAILGAHLTHICPCYMPLSPAQRLLGKSKNVIVSHRPIHWYAKGYRRGNSLMPDVFISPKRDKLGHAWAQGEGGVWVPIEHLTAPGDLIVDPFAGTGTWGRIAAEMGRRWIGADLAEGGTTTIAA